MLSLTEKKEKMIVNSKSMATHFGYISGTIKSYDNRIVSADRALDDIRDIVNEWNEKVKSELLK